MAKQPPPLGVFSLFHHVSKKGMISINVITVYYKGGCLLLIKVFVQTIYFIG